MASEILSKLIKEHNAEIAVPKKLADNNISQNQIIDDFLLNDVDQYMMNNAQPCDQQDPESEDDQDEEDLAQMKKKKSRKSKQASLLFSKSIFCMLCFAKSIE